LRGTSGHPMCGCSWKKIATYRECVHEQRACLHFPRLPVYFGGVLHARVTWTLLLRWSGRDRQRREMLMHPPPPAEDLSDLVMLAVARARGEGWVGDVGDKWGVRAHVPC